MTLELEHKKLKIPILKLLMPAELISMLSTEKLTECKLMSPKMKDFCKLTHQYLMTEELKELQEKLKKVNVKPL